MHVNLDVFNLPKQIRTQQTSFEPKHRSKLFVHEISVPTCHTEQQGRDSAHRIPFYGGLLYSFCANTRAGRKGTECTTGVVESKRRTLLHANILIRIFMSLPTNGCMYKCIHVHECIQKRINLSFIQIQKIAGLARKMKRVLPLLDCTSKARQQETEIGSQRQQRISPSTCRSNQTG